jgi:hypothetical protein
VILNLEEFPPPEENLDTERREYIFDDITSILFALRTLIPFVSTYFCESGFSTLLQIKSKQRNLLDIENDMHCSLSNISPRIMDLVKKKKTQISH